MLKRRYDDPAAPGDYEEEEVVEEEVPPAAPPPRIWPWLLALLLLVLGGLLAYWLLTREGDKTTMPRVVGLTEPAARARLAEAELEVDVDRRPSRRPRGVVFAQTPGAGNQLDEGTRVEIAVSSALIRVVVPSVRELPLAEAREKVEDAGLKVSVRRVFAGLAEGRVVEQDPRGGERAERGSTVELIVSKGRNLNRVPDVLGLTEEEAVRALRAQEFEPRIFDVPAPDPRGTVVAQLPRAGVLGPPDARVRINVSTGEPTGTPTERTQTTPPPTTTGSATQVPNVVGLAQTAALRRLRSAQLQGVVAYRTSDARPGRVLAQQRLAGRQVRIVVASPPDAEPLDVPDVRGSDEESARATLEDAGFRVEVITVASGGSVTDQQPRAGVTSYRGAVVTLIVG